MCLSPLLPKVFLGTESPWIQSVMLNGPRAGTVLLYRVSRSQTKQPYVGSITWSLSVGEFLIRKEAGAPPLG